MSDDLVKRLRDEDNDEPLNELLDAAADRIEELGSANDKLSCDALQLYACIEKLEAALREIASCECYYIGDIVDIACKALEGKDE